MFGYSDNIIRHPTLDWKNVNLEKYVKNILVLSKHQTSASFKQLNLKKDVREWDLLLNPSQYNAAYNPDSNILCW